MNEILKKIVKSVPYKKVLPIDVNDAYKEGFKNGAEYALSNQWISVEEALPEYDEAVLVIDKTGIEETGVYFNHRSNNPMVKTYENGFCDIGMSEVMYWCEVPKFETKTE